MKKIVLSIICVALFATFTVGAFAGEKKEEKVKGSLKIPSEHAYIASLAKITLVEAINAALKHTPGIAMAAGIEEEDGYLAFEVMIATKKEMMEVVVDAGNGKILKSEVEDEEHDEEYDEDDEYEDEDEDDDDDDDRRRRHRDRD